MDFTEEIIDASFGSWMFTLFQEIKERNPELSFSQRKDEFFALVQDLLTKGLIKFIAPGADCYVSPARPHPRLTIDDIESHWAASPAQIVAQLREMWPDGIYSDDDHALLIYFYEIPGVIWVDEDGAFISGD